MAKLVKSFENGEIKTVLTFRSKDYTLTMGAYVDGVSKSKEKALEDQVFDDYKEDPLRDIIVDTIDGIDCQDDDEIIETLESLEGFE